MLNVFCVLLICSYYVLTFVLTDTGTGHISIVFALFLVIVIIHIVHIIWLSIHTNTSFKLKTKLASASTLILFSTLICWLLGSCVYRFILFLASIRLALYKLPIFEQA